MAPEQILSDYGAWGVMLGAMFEGETMVMLGGMLVHRGAIGFAPAVAAAAMGSFMADQILFFLGRYMRRLAWVERLCRSTAFMRVSGLCERHPRLFVFGFRFLYGMRTISPLAIGASAVPTRLFVLVNLLAAWIWALLFVSLGYLFGVALQRMLGHLHLGHYVLALAVLAGAAAMAIGLLRRRARSSRPARSRDGG